MIFGLAYLNPVLNEHEAVGSITEDISIISQRNPDCPFFIMGDLKARMDLLNQVEDPFTAVTHLASNRTSLDNKTRSALFAIRC